MAAEVRKATGRGPLVGFLLLATWSQTAMSVVQQGIAVLAVFIRETERLTLTQMGLITSATSLGIVVGFLAVGRLVDRRGPRVVLAWGTAWAVLAALGVAVASTYVLRLLALAALGVGLATFPAAGTRAVFDAFTGARRGLAMSLRQTGVPVGSAIAAAVLPVLAVRWGPTPIFVGDAALLLLAGLPFAVAMRPKTVAGSVAGPGLRALAGAVLPFITAAVMVAGQYVPLTFALPTLHAEFGWPLTVAGIGLVVVQMGGIAGRVLFGWWSDRRGQRPPAIRAAAVLGAGAAAGIAMLPRAVGWLPLIGVLFGLGVGAVGWNALVLTWAGERVPPARAGQAMSLTGAVVYLGSTVYPPLFGWVADMAHSMRPGWWGLAAWLAAAAILVSAAGRKTAPGGLTASGSTA